MTRARDISDIITDADLAGNIDVDGTANLDVVDIDGALTQDGGAVFNEDSADVDFRVESNGDANMLFIDGGNDRLLVRKSDPTNADQAFHLGAGGDDHKMILQGNSVQRIGLQNGTSSRVFLGAAADNHFRLSKQDASVLLDVNSSGNIILGQSGAGIHLGVTSATASNLLDDYEEGTWTPTLVSTSATFQYSVQSGFYTKIGRVVNFTCVIQLDGGGNSFTNNSVALNGWPFQSTANAHSRFFIYGRYLNLDLGNGYTYAYAHLNGDSSSATLHESGDNVPTATIVSNDLSSSSGQLYLNGQYITDS